MESAAYEPSDHNPADYEPEVNDYVIWDQGEYGKHEGWVYFKGDPVDNEKRIKDGWKPVSRYITIETSIRPKPHDDYAKGDPHQFIHTLLLCYESEWSNLIFVKKRKSKNISHWSQYDDIAGNE